MYETAPCLVSQQRENQPLAFRNRNLQHKLGGRESQAKIPFLEGKATDLNGKQACRGAACSRWGQEQPSWKRRTGMQGDSLYWTGQFLVHALTERHQTQQSYSNCSPAQFPIPGSEFTFMFTCFRLYLRLNEHQWWIFSVPCWLAAC